MYYFHYHTCLTLLDVSDLIKKCIRYIDAKKKKKLFYETLVWIVQHVLYECHLSPDTDSKRVESKKKIIFFWGTLVLLLLDFSNTCRTDVIKVSDTAKRQLPTPRGLHAS